jgi:hypothetical protein
MIAKKALDLKNVDSIVAFMDFIFYFRRCYA